MLEFLLLYRPASFGDIGALISEYCEDFSDWENICKFEWLLCVKHIFIIYSNLPFP